MTPQEKAKELIEKYQKLDIEIGGQYDGYLTMKIHDAKQCALIAIDEIIEELKGFNSDDGYFVLRIDFWDDVKSELSKL
jgi:hypothetical protein